MADGATEEVFGFASRKTTFRKGVGLPGLVWERNEPVIMADLGKRWSANGMGELGHAPGCQPAGVCGGQAFCRRPGEKQPDDEKGERKGQAAEEREPEDKRKIVEQVGGIESGQDQGVWGGLSEDERRALKRRNARARIRA